MANNKTKGILGFLLSLIINLFILYFLIHLFSFSYGFAYRVFANEPYVVGQATPVVITINKGTSSMNIAQTLEDKQVIESKYAFYCRIKFSKFNGKIKPGTYEVSASMKTDQILEILSGELEEESEE